MFNALRNVVKTGIPWRAMPHDLLHGAAVYWRAGHWFRVGMFEALAGDLRVNVRGAAAREPAPSAAVMDSRNRQSTPESGSLAGCDGAKRRKGSKPHPAVDAMGHQLTLQVIPANTKDRAEKGRLARAVQEATGESIGSAYADQGYTGDRPAQAAQEHGIRLGGGQAPGDQMRLRAPPPRWVVKRTFAACSAMKRLHPTLEILHVVAFMPHARESRSTDLGAQQL